MKQYLDWHQDLASVTLTFKIKNTTRRKIFISQGDLFVKVTCPEKGIAKIIDLFKEIDFSSSKNTVKYSNNKLDVHLMKLKKGIWESIEVQNMSRAEKRDRRNESLIKLEKYEQEKSQAIRDKKLELGEITLKEKMRLNQEKRQLIETRQENVKQDAIDEVYNHIEGDSQPQQKSLENQNSKKSKVSVSGGDNDIWDMEDIKKLSKNEENQKIEEEEKKLQKEVPKIRKTETTVTKMQFSDKIIPTAAARERYIKEAPLPRLKNLFKKKNIEGDFQNPLWMKDKGNQFFQSNDFLSAINAYDSALQLDEKMISALSNRSICNMKLFNISDAIEDCTNIQKIYAEFDDDQKQLPEYLNIFQKSRVREALCEAYLGKLETCQTKLRGIKEDKAVPESVIPTIEADITKIGSRIRTIEEKVEADKAYQNKEYQIARQKYEELLEREPKNERIQANLSVVHYMDKDYENTINLSTQALDKLHEYMTHGMKQGEKVDKFLKAFYCKLLLRRAKSRNFQSASQVDKVREDIRSILLVDEMHKGARALQRSIEETENFRIGQEKKTEGDNLLRAGDIKGAVASYDQGMRMIGAFEHPVEYISLVLNSTVAFTKLEDFEEVVCKAIHGLKIIYRFKNQLIRIRNQDLTQDEKEKLKSFEVRLLMRRGQSYLKLGQLFHAKGDFSEVLKIQPENQEVKDVMKSIGASQYLE